MVNADLCFDAWTIRMLSNDDFGQEHWDNNDEIDYQFHDGNENSDDDEGDHRAIQDFEEEDDDDWNNFGSTDGFRGDAYNRNNDFGTQRRDDRWDSGQGYDGTFVLVLLKKSPRVLLGYSLVHCMTRFRAKFFRELRIECEKIAGPVILF